MAFLLLFPGSLSPLLRLQDVLRERHENLRALEAKDLKRRTDNQIPLDDSVDWPAVQKAATAGDAAAVLALVARSTATPPMGEYEPVDGYEDIEVRFRALSDAQRSTLLVDLAVASEARRVAVTSGFDRGVGKAIVEADIAIAAAEIAFLRAAVADLVISGKAHDLGDAKVQEAVSSTGPLLAHLFVAARDYQTLPPGKAPRFG